MADQDGGSISYYWQGILCIQTLFPTEFPSCVSAEERSESNVIRACMHSNVFQGAINVNMGDFVGVQCGKYDKKTLIGQVTRQM